MKPTSPVYVLDAQGATCLRPPGPPRPTWPWLLIALALAIWTLCTFGLRVLVGTLIMLALALFFG